jgi:DNA polymerase zeta
MHEGRSVEQKESPDLKLGSPHEEIVFVPTKSPLSRDETPKAQAGEVEDVMEVDASLLLEQAIQGPTPSDKERTALITARAVELSKVFNAFKTENKNRFTYALRPPTRAELKDGMKTLNMPSKLYQAPYYSRDEDIPELPKEFAGLTFHLKGGQGIAHLEDWETDKSMNEGLYYEADTTCELNSVGVGGWEYAHHPPSTRELRRTMFLIEDDVDTKAKFRSQVRDLCNSIFSYLIITFRHRSKVPHKQTSMVSIHLLLNPLNMSSTKLKQCRYCRLRYLVSDFALSMKICLSPSLVPTIENKVPNPESDSIVAIFYAHITRENILQSGAIVIEDSPLDQQRLRPPNTESVQDEVELLNRLIDLVVDFDPDIVTGWEVQNNSWGFINSRGNFLSKAKQI